MLLFNGCDKVRFRVYKDNEETNVGIENDEDNNDISDKKNDGSDDVNDNDINKPANSQTENAGLLGSMETQNTYNPSPTAIQPTQNVELMIYVVDNSDDLDPVYALVPADKEITPQLIVDTVVDSMADRSIFIGIESVTTEGDTVIVSFSSDKAPLKDVGAGFETAILNAIAQSIVDNLDEYNKVIYRVEGGPYKSGHLELGIDEVYFEDTR